MKKTIAIVSLALGFTAVSVFGQGFLQIATPGNIIYDGFSTPGSSSAAGSAVTWSLYWAANNTAKPFAALNGSPGAATPTSGNSTTVQSWTAAQAWAALAGASSFTLATDSSTYGPLDGSGTIPVTDNAISGGSLGFYSQDSVVGPGFGFGIDGTSASTFYSLLVVGYQSAGSGPIGWSYLSSFKLASSASDPNIASPSFTAFGVFQPTVAGVPEPSTLALAGLGGFGMLMAMRRKKA